MVARTRSNFAKLPIQRFFPLYKSCRIWPNTFLAEYLAQYVIHRGIKIYDGTWKVFFMDISERLVLSMFQYVQAYYTNLNFHRYSGAHAHYFVKDFLQKVADIYKSEDRAEEFVLDLLKLQVPKLLSTENAEEAKDQEVRSEFKRFLQDFIKRNALEHSILTRASAIVVC